MSWRGDFGRSLPSPSTSEDRHVISHQVVCPFIGAFDLTLLWCSSVISSPYADKMLMERRRNHCPKKASSQNPCFSFCALVFLVLFLSNQEEWKALVVLTLLPEGHQLVHRQIISPFKKRLQRYLNHPGCLPRGTGEYWITVICLSPFS